MNPAHPLEFATFFAKLENFFANSSKELQQKGFEIVDHQAHFVHHRLLIGGAILYEIWLRLITSEECGVVWRLILTFDAESISAKAECLSRSEQGEEHKNLKSKEYSSFENLNVDIVSWEISLSESIEYVAQNLKS